MIDFNDPITISVINLLLVLLVTSLLGFYRYIFPKKEIGVFVLLFLMASLSTLSIFREGTYRTGDLTPHYVQLMNFYQNLKEGVVIPRWAGDLCGGYGCPIFVLEYILPYYIASFFHFIGFSFLISMKLVLVFAYIFSGITMYLWAKEEFGKVAGFISALFYLYAPYHLIDLHFRGSVGEVLSFVFIPLLFLFTKKLIETTKKEQFFFLAIIFLSLILTHSSTTLICGLLCIGYAGIVWLRKKKRKIMDIILFFAALSYGIVLAAFYWLPAISEVKYTWWVYTTFGDFKPITEYLYSPILYGFLFQGHQGEYRLIIGYFHLLAIGFASFLLIKNKIEKKLKFLLVFFLSAFFILFFMLQAIAKPVWEHVSLLHTFIVVWRLLVPIAFVTAAIAGIIIKSIKVSNKVIILLSLILVTSTVLNWANRKMIPIDAQPFLKEAEIYTEYFEKGNPIFEQSLKKNQLIVHSIVAHPPSEHIKFLKGEGEIVQLKRTQTSHEYILEAKDNAIVMDNTNYFPGWKVLVNNQEVPINYYDKQYPGKIIFKLNKGVYLIDITFSDSPIRELARNISVVGLLMGTLYLLIIFCKRRMLRE